MADYGTRRTDEAVKRTERRLRSIYLEAQRDMAEKLAEWKKGHKEREAKYRKMVAEGKMSQADFNAWMRGQVFQGKQWRARKEQIDNILLNADRAAANIVNRGKLGVFTENANYIGYGLEHDLGINSGFLLYDEGTVARLIADDPQMLPKPAPGVVKEKAFPYYNKLMSSAIAQGIIQGESIEKIAQRIIEKTGESSYASAVRNARTAFTGAQNAGRIEGLHQAQELGIEVKKKWMATFDFRTRDTHRELDGQVRDVDDPFVVDGDEIMYPGDPRAKARLVYNCRCTLVYEYPEYQRDGAKIPRRDNITGEDVGAMNYQDWFAMKAARMLTYGAKITQKATTNSNAVNQRPITQPSGTTNSVTNYAQPITQPGSESYSDTPELHGTDEWIKACKANPDIRAMLSKEEAYFARLTTEEADALKNYTGSNFIYVNGYLRDKAAGANDKLLQTYSQKAKDDARNCHNALTKASLDRNMVLRRGTDLGDIAGLFMNGDFNKNKQLLRTKSVEELNSMFAGQVGTYAGLTSTSSQWDKGFLGNVEILINAPKGARAASIMKISKYGTREGEVLLIDGSRVFCRGIERITAENASPNSKVGGIRVFLDLIGYAS